MRPSKDVAVPAHPPTTTNSLAPLLHWIFRAAFFMEFVGHGAFGLIGKSAWLPYFGVAGIGEPTAWRLMPLIGMVDIAVGITTLFRPMRAFLLYGTIWGLWTALLRPLSGEPIWETLERAGNYGVPLAFLMWSGWPARRSQWFERIKPSHAPYRGLNRTRLVVRLSLGLLLIGHGAFGAFMHKPMLADQWASIGVHGLPFAGAPIVPAAGWLDLALGIAVLVHPATWLLAFITLWKVTCELLYPISGAPIWEFVERGGSYGAPLALLVLESMRRRPRSVPAAATPGAAEVSPAESAPA